MILRARVRTYCQNCNVPNSYVLRKLLVSVANVTICQHKFRCYVIWRSCWYGSLNSPHDEPKHLLRKNSRLRRTPMIFQSLEKYDLERFIHRTPDRIILVLFSEFVLVSLKIIYIFSTTISNDPPRLFVRNDQNVYHSWRAGALQLHREPKESPFARN